MCLCISLEGNGCLSSIGISRKLSQGLHHKFASMSFQDQIYCQIELWVHDNMPLHQPLRFPNLCSGGTKILWDTSYPELLYVCQYMMNCVDIIKITSLKYLLLKSSVRYFGGNMFENSIVSYYIMINISKFVYWLVRKQESEMYNSLVSMFIFRRQMHVLIVVWFFA